MVFLTKIGFENLKKVVAKLFSINFSHPLIYNFWEAHIQLEERNQNFLNSDVMYLPKPAGVTVLFLTKLMKF